MDLLHRARQWLAMLSLRSQLLLIAAGSTLAGLLIVMPSSLTLHRQETEAESRMWASALVRLAARASSTLLEEQDLASLDGTLQEIASLPGVRSLQVVAPGGRPVLRVEHRPDGNLVTVRNRHADALPTPKSFERIEADRMHAVASLLAATREAGGQQIDLAQLGRDGWVELEFSHAEHMVSARRNWTAAALATVLLVAVALGLFALFLRRTVQPLQALSRFAGTLARNPGQTTTLRWGSREVRDLGLALNWSSQELARRIGETQQKLNRLHAILDTAVDAIIGVDGSGRITSTNPATERMFGRPAEALIGQPLSHFLPDMDGPFLAQTMEGGMLIHSTQSRIGHVETRALRHGGTEFPVEVLLGEIQGDPSIRFTCIVRDQSDSRLAEEYLTLYGRAVDCTLNGIMISDARRYPQPLVHINPAFTRITGYAPHEVLGRDAGFLNGPQTDADDLALLARTLREGGELTITLRCSRKDGSQFHNKLSVSPVRDSEGAITHYIHVMEDVSSQIEVKQRLIERTARLNATFDLSPDGFAVFDAGGDLISSNPAFRAMVGEVPAWCSLSRFDTWFRELCDDITLYRPIAAALRDRQKDTIALARPARKVLEREIRRNLGGSGETILYFRDVTHQVEVDRMKSEFLATAAHELRTPLASILGFTELMIHRKYPDEKRLDLLQTVHRQGSLLQDLIQELLDLSRIEARQGKDFRIVPTSLADIVDHAVKGITNAEVGRVVHLEEPVPADLLVMADATKIEQSLTNLLSNAFKYSPHGGRVALRVTRADHEDTPGVLIHISDQGIGMTPAQLARAFERFYRADSSGNIPGTGLGLNLVKEIADIHGGAVSLTSVPGQGTTATLRLRTATVAQPLTQPA